MKRFLTPRKCALAAALLAGGGSVAAASLGEAAGAATLGRPLRLDVPVTFADLAEAQRPCARAQVQYGETPAGGARVDILGEGLQARAAIRASAPVDEPVVSVLLHLGCGAGVSRRYVLLADPPGAQEPGSPAVTAPVATAPAPAPAAVLGAAAAAPRPQKAATPRARPATAATAAMAVPAAMPAEPRLRLATLDPATERAVLLRVSAGLLAAPVEDHPGRAAAAALWQAVSAQPQDLLRMADRLRVLEADMAGLREASARQRRELAGLREMAGPPDRRMDWMAAALAVLAAASAAAFFGWRARSRTSDAARWSHFDLNSGFTPEPAAVQPPVAVPPPAAAAPAPSPAEQEAPLPFAAVDAEPPAPVLPAPAAAEIAATPAPVEAGPATLELPPLELAFDAAEPAPMLEPFDFDLSAPAPAAAAPRAEQLIEVQQQAAFLCAVGQFEEALQLLDAHIEEAREAPVLAFLELMAIQRGLGDAHGFEKTRTRFKRRFGFLPDGWDEFAPGEGIEAQPAWLAPLQAAWGRAEVFAAIDRLLFAPPRGAAGMPGLAAGRELLWLWALAQAREQGSEAADSAPQEEAGLPFAV